MKNALLICGQLRTFYDVWPNMKKNVVDKLNCDVFIHTWKNTGFGRRANHLNIEESEVNIDDLYKLTNAKKIVVEDFKEEYQDKIGEIVMSEELKKLEPIHYKNNLALFYTLFKANELKKQYETENMFLYDNVIKTRPDIDFKTEIPNDVFNYTKECLMQWSFRINTQNQVCDKLVVSNSKIIDYYSSVFTELNNYYQDLGNNKRTRPVGERLMYRHMSKSKYPIESFTMDAYIKHVSFLNENQNKEL